MYVMTRDFYLVDSEAPEYEDKGATYLLFVYDTETQAWSVDQNLASKRLRAVRFDGCKR